MLRIKKLSSIIGESLTMIDEPFTITVDLFYKYTIPNSKHLFLQGL